jgi:hypothetical protein
VVVNNDVPGVSHSTKVTSDQPIIAERPMYFTFPLNPSINGGHNVIGFRQ